MNDSTPAIRRHAVVAAVSLAAVVALAPAAPASAAEHDHSNSTPVAIPDPTSGDCTSDFMVNPAVSTIEVAQYGIIDDITLELDIDHTWRGDLVAELESPEGTTRRLFTRIGRVGTNCGSNMDAFRVTLDDAATTSINHHVNPGNGTFAPQQSLDAFHGENAQGTWTLRVYDASRFDTGTLNSWSLQLSTITELSIADATVDEGQPVLFTVTRSGDLSGIVSVDYMAVDDTALAGSDYVAAGGTITFAPGEASRILSIPTLGDTVVEAAETFSVLLSGPVGATVIDGTAIGTILDRTPVLSPGAPPTAEIGHHYSFATGGSGAPVLNYTATGLDGTGLSIDPDTGEISGTPAAVGSHPVTVTVSNGPGSTATASFTIEVGEPIVLGAWVPTPGTVGEGYSHPFTATGPGTLEYAASGLPSGLSIDPASGIISGTPDAPGTFPVTVTVTNSGTSLPRSTASADIVITPAGGSGGSDSGSGDSGSGGSDAGSDGSGDGSGGSDGGSTGPAAGGEGSLVSTGATAPWGLAAGLLALGLGAVVLTRRRGAPKRG